MINSSFWFGVGIGGVIVTLIFYIDVKRMNKFYMEVIDNLRKEINTYHKMFIDLVDRKLI